MFSLSKGEKARKAASLHFAPHHRSCRHSSRRTCRSHASIVVQPTVRTLPCATYCTAKNCEIPCQPANCRRICHRSPTGTCPFRGGGSCGTSLRGSLLFQQTSACQSCSTRKTGNVNSHTSTRHPPRPWTQDSHPSKSPCTHPPSKTWPDRRI